MNNPKPEKQNNFNILLDKIKEKYNEYCLRQGDKYRPIPFNSTPDPYQLLVESFKEELSLLLGKSRADVSGMIPSPSLFAQMFRTQYVPKGDKLHACYLYATGKSQIAFENILNENNLENTEEPLSRVEATLLYKKQNNRKLFIVGAFIPFIILSVYLFYYEPSFSAPPTGLVVEYPTNNSIVPRQTLAKGRVSNARVVWLVVRKSLRCWVQPPIKVEEDGTWEGPIYIGSEAKEDIGVRVQIQAFTNPVKSLKEGDELHSWPKAQLSSKVLEVVRGAKDEE